MQKCNAKMQCKNALQKCGNVLELDSVLINVIKTKAEILESWTSGFGAGFGPYKFLTVGS